MPWFALGDVYRSRRDDYRASNGGFVVHGYGEWMWRHAFVQAAAPLHPHAGGPAAGLAPSHGFTQPARAYATARRDTSPSVNDE